MANTTGGALFGKNPADGSVIRLGCVRNIQKASAERSRDTELCIDDPEVLNSLPGNQLTIGDTTFTLRDDKLAEVEAWCDWLYEGDANPDPALPECLRFLTCLVFATPDGRACFMPGWLVSETENQRTRNGDNEVAFVFAVNSPPKQNIFNWETGVPARPETDEFLVPVQNYFATVQSQAATGQPMKVGQILGDQKPPKTNQKPPKK